MIDDPTAMRFTELLGIRNPTVHGGELSGRAVQSKHAIDLLYAVTAKLFGDKHPRFFRAPGEWYVRSGFEHDPLTAKFVIPHCARVGYRHEVVSSEGRAEIRDLGSYPEEAITDEEFARRRQEWQESRSKAP